MKKVHISYKSLEASFLQVVEMPNPHITLVHVIRVFLKGPLALTTFKICTRLYVLPLSTGLCFLQIFLPILDIFLKNVFIWLHWIFAAAASFSLVTVGGGYCLLQGHWLLHFPVAFLAVEHSCGARGPQWLWHTGLVPRHGWDADQD